jgi:hypothetical protein
MLLQPSFRILWGHDFKCSAFQVSFGRNKIWITWRIFLKIWMNAMTLYAIRP